MRVLAWDTGYGKPVAHHAMEPILIAPHRSTFESFARSNVLITLDYDGTLAPIVVEPPQAFMRPHTRLLLKAVCNLYPCAVVSGRARVELHRFLDGINVRELVGNHGIEPFGETRQYAKLVEGWMAYLAEWLPPIPGIELETKGYSLTIHYRQCRDRRAASDAIRRAVAGLAGAKIGGGKMVVNLLPEGAPNKGVAVERLLSKTSCEKAIFVGDDDTDEDVFALEQHDRILGIRVGAKQSSKARYYVRNQEQVDALLDLLVSVRQST